MTMSVYVLAQFMLAAQRAAMATRTSVKRLGLLRRRHAPGFAPRVRRFHPHEGRCRRPSAAAGSCTMRSMCPVGTFVRRLAEDITTKNTAMRSRGGHDLAKGGLVIDGKVHGKQRHRLEDDAPAPFLAQFGEDWPRNRRLWPDRIKMGPHRPRAVSKGAAQREVHARPQVAGRPVRQPILFHLVQRAMNVPSGLGRRGRCPCPGEYGYRRNAAYHAAVEIDAGQIAVEAESAAGTTEAMRPSAIVMSRSAKPSRLAPRPDPVRSDSGTFAFLSR